MQIRERILRIRCDHVDTVRQEPARPDREDGIRNKKIISIVVATFQSVSYKEMQGQKGEFTMEDKKVLNNEELEKVSGGFGNHEYEFGMDNIAMEDKKTLQCGIDGNNADPSGGISREEILEPVDCSGLIP